MYTFYTFMIVAVADDVLGDNVIFSNDDAVARFLNFLSIILLALCI